MTQSDRDLGRAFEELRAEDAASAPDFLSVWKRAADASKARQHRAPRYLWLAAAGVLAVAAGVAVQRARWDVPTQTVSLAVSDTIAELMRWTPPTDGLLPATQALHATPTILESVFDGSMRMSIDTNSHKGD